MPRTSDEAVCQAAWPIELLRRFQTLWVVKGLGTTFGIWGFLAAYFWLLHHPFYPVTVMPVTAIDRAIGVHPVALPLYLSLWVYVSLGPALLESMEEIICYALSAFAMSAVGLGIFLLWPTATPSFDIDWSQYPSMVFLKNHDLAGNAFPSMHVAFSVFTAILLEDLLRQVNAGPMLRTLNWLWCLGILYSTLATAQHVVLDLLGGAALGAVAGMLLLCLLGSRQRIDLLRAPQ